MLFFEKDFLSKARECLRMFIEDYDESSNPTVKSHKKIFLQAFKSKYVPKVCCNQRGDYLILVILKCLHVQKP